MKQILRYSQKQLRAAGLTVITAHSGCEGTPPNSLAHILAAIDSGAEMVEVDIRAHGESLYLSHDVAEDPTACVSFDAFLELVAATPALQVNCDVKTDGLILPVMEVANRYGQGWRILFTGQCNHRGELIESAGAELWTSLWPTGDNETAVREACETYRGVGEPILNLHYSMISEENYASLPCCDSVREIGRIVRHVPFPARKQDVWLRCGQARRAERGYGALLSL